MVGCTHQLGASTKDTLDLSLHVMQSQAPGHGMNMCLLQCVGRQSDALSFYRRSSSGILRLSMWADKPRAPVVVI